MKNLNTDINKAKKLNTNKKYISQYDKNKLLTKIKTNINNVKKKYKGSNKNKILKSLNTAYKNAKKTKALKVNSIKKTTADKYVKGVTTKNKDRTFKETYDYKDNKMQWFEVANSTTIDQRPAGLRWTTSKQNTTTLKGKYVNYVIPKTTKTTYSNGIRTVVVNESFQVTGLKSSAKNKYLLLINTTKTKENYTYLANKYLASSTKCEVNDPYIKELAKNITKSYKSDDHLGKANAIYKWVQKYVDYVEDANYSAMGVLNNSHKVNGRYVANCVGFSNLISALSRSVGVPVRYRSILFFRDYDFLFDNPHGGHVWSEVYVNGKWQYADGATLDNSAIVSVGQGFDLQQIKPTSAYYTTDNINESWYLDCNHYLNSSHKDSNIEKTPPGINSTFQREGNDYFIFSTTSVTTGNKAISILNSALNLYIATYNYYYKPVFISIKSTFVELHGVDPISGNNMVFWLVHAYKNGVFCGYFELGENGIAYPFQSGIPFFSNGTIISII
ncbi:transglutaminase-like superfamily protein [Methanobrevibacter cuticularis]|uniref:Transglutaminase-like superfamily protein n=1 Tax=Methanobrevibacter cuticularis TaxID=47311 RepID=A0A166CMA0_9EURY|nr:transglutaminase-like superfamily protein [Methanobrevibacter cuticularis]